jgi:uncharacterized protein YndB with AHSA1/START domain
MNDVEPIRRSVTVRCTPERAFRVFTDQMDAWWPLETHGRAADQFADEGVKAERLEVQGRIGGQIIEHMSNGVSLPWGEFVVWEPPTRLVLAWKPHSRPVAPTEVEVQFLPDGDGTRVELEHRGWERVGAEAAEVRDAYGSPQGWITTLNVFAAAIEQEVA